MKPTKALYTAVLCLCVLQANAEPSTKVSILGDSYSTFEGCVSPKTNEVWYFNEPKLDKTDLTDASQTWWRLLLEDNTYCLEKNNSYSGATICTTGYNGADYSDRSFISRFHNLGNPDLILIFGATNDSWANSPVGEFKWEGWNEEDLKTFRPALAYLLDHLTSLYPQSRFLYIINDGLKDEITASIIEGCNHYGLPYVELQDIEKTYGHPNTSGMRQIASQVADALASR